MTENYTLEGFKKFDIGEITHNQLRGRNDTWRQQKAKDYFWYSLPVLPYNDKQKRNDIHLRFTPGNTFVQGYRWPAIFIPESIDIDKYFAEINKKLDADRF